MSTTTAIAPIAQDLFDAIEANGIDHARMDYSVTDERVPDHTVRFTDKADADRIRHLLEKGAVSTPLTVAPDSSHPFAVHFNGATRVKKATRILKSVANGQPTPRNLAMTTSVATLPMTKTQARRLVDQIRSDVRDLAAKLRELRDRLGWKALDYDSWAACVKEEFGYSKRWANLQIAALKVRGQVGTMVPTPSPNGGAMPERHARELARLPDDQQAECHQDYQEECEAADVKPTAAGLREKVDLWLADNEPVDVESEPVVDHAGDNGDQRHAGGDHGGDDSPQTDKRLLQDHIAALRRYLAKVRATWPAEHQTILPNVLRSFADEFDAELKDGLDEVEQDGDAQSRPPKEGGHRAHRSGGAHDPRRTAADGEDKDARAADGRRP